MLFAALPLIACEPKSQEAAPEAPPPEPAELTVRMEDYSFIAPDTIAPGVTKIRIVDEGKVPHHAILARLDSGKTMVDLEAAVKAGTEQPAWLRIVGGGGAILPGADNVTYSDLTPGNYVLLCFLQDNPKAPPHLALGMIKPLVVAGERSLAVMPAADAELKLVDYGFEVPALAAGQHILRLVNEGKESHEIVVIRMPDGMSLDGFLKEVAAGNTEVGPPLGGNGAVEAGGSNLWSVNFAPGHYALLCFVPSPGDKVPHVMKGMSKELVISAAS